MQSISSSSGDGANVPKNNNNNKKKNLIATWKGATHRPISSEMPIKFLLPLKFLEEEEEGEKTGELSGTQRDWNWNEGDHKGIFGRCRREL